MINSLVFSIIFVLHLVVLAVVVYLLIIKFTSKSSDPIYNALIKTGVSIGAGFLLLYVSVPFFSILISKLIS